MKRSLLYFQDQIPSKKCVVNHNYIMEKVYEVIIIGAGASGIGASSNLSKKGIDHIIL